MQAEKMLEAAARLFGSQRFHEVRMEDIAAEAAVGKGTLYRYFSDKEELYAALLERASHQFMSRLEEALEGAGGPLERLKLVAATSLAFFEDQPHVSDLIQRAETHTDPSRLLPWQQVRNRTHQLVLDLFAEARARGDFTIRDPELAVLMFLGGLRSVIRFGPRPQPRNLAQRVVDCFLEAAELPSSDGMAFQSAREVTDRA
jgi:AcrR family transcriptional regulator